MTAKVFAAGRTKPKIFASDQMAEQYAYRQQRKTGNTYTVIYEPTAQAKLEGREAKFWVNWADKD